MLEIKGNLFEQKCDVICITTNGFVKNNGECVMGKGCAKTVTQLDPELPSILGHKLIKGGNQVYVLKEYDDVTVCSFPVKPVSAKYMEPKDVVAHMRSKFSIGSMVCGWACTANPDIIVQSCKEIVALADLYKWTSIVIPRMGCGAGELEWSDIKILVEDILDDRFSIITF